MCGAPGAPCDALCGGGGCGRCGGESCDGAVTKANTALKLAQQAEDLLTSKEDSANALLADVRGCAFFVCGCVMGGEGEGASYQQWEMHEGCVSFCVSV